MQSAKCIRRAPDPDNLGDMDALCVTTVLAIDTDKLGESRRRKAKGPTLQRINASMDAELPNCDEDEGEGSWVPYIKA